MEAQQQGMISLKEGHMRRKVKEAMNTHEKLYPDQRELNDLSIEDLKSLGNISPARPLALHVGYVLDGHHQNRGRYGRNYDYRLLPEEKKAVDREVSELAELALMLQNPEYIMDNSHQMPSENHQLAQEVLKHFIMKHGPQESQPHLEKELYDPLITALVDRIQDQESILELLLAPHMVKESEHTPNDYSSMLKAHFLFPAHKGRSEGHWGQNIPKIFAMLGGEGGV